MKVKVTEISNGKRIVSIPEGTEIVSVNNFLGYLLIECGFVEDISEWRPMREFEHKSFPTIKMGYMKNGYLLVDADIKHLPGSPSFLEFPPKDNSMGDYEYYLVVGEAVLDYLRDLWEYIRE